jgi:hypothetical protein
LPAVRVLREAAASTLATCDNTLVMTQRKSASRTDGAVVPAQKPTALLADLRGLIHQAREGVARAVDSSLTTLYWHVGQRIRQDILKEKRAEYGGQIVAALGRQLETEFGRGFSRRNLFNMVRFSEVFPDFRIVQPLTAQLSWTHFSLIIYLDNPLQRDFYAEMCRLERWSTRTLEKKIGSMLYERTALSRKPEKLAALELKQLREEDKVTRSDFPRPLHPRFPRLERHLRREGFGSRDPAGNGSVPPRTGCGALFCRTPGANAN